MLPALKEIDACLPQTQCTRCGYPRCLAYAQALAAGAADINQCPPGGEITIAMLAPLLGRAVKPLNPAFGQHGQRQRAVIVEPDCIGCRKCIDVCPVDAILGARQFMHSVLEADCNGCALCVPACPVDCITLVPAEWPEDPDSPWPEYSRAEVQRWSLRTAARLARLQLQQKLRVKPGSSLPASNDRERIRSEIRAAVDRVHAKKSARAKKSS